MNKSLFESIRTVPLLPLPSPSNLKLLVGFLFVAVILSASLAIANIPLSVRGETSIPKPAVPEFTVKLVDYSYYVPATQSVDPYTGETVTQPAHRVENRSIEVRIKNQPFTPYQIRDSNGSEWTANFFYNIRAKGHFGQDWTEVFHPSDGFPTQSDSEYTVISFSSTGGEDFYATSTSVVHAPTGGQVDFQVQAMIGYVHREITVPVPGTGWVFTGETSGWSDTQTLTIGESQTPTPSPAATPTSTPSQEPQQTEQIEPIVSATIVMAVIIASLGLLIYLIRRK